ncbi:MAG: fatty acyl-AMP ligase [Acidobacteriota bacterium]
MLAEFATIVELLQYRAVSSAKRLAYTFLANGEVEESTLTFGQLDQQARVIAACLQQENLAQGRVLLLYQPGLEFIAALFGCFYSASVAIPFYPPHPARFASSIAKLQALIKDAQPSLVLTTLRVKQAAEAALTEQQLPPLPWIATDTLAADIYLQWQKPDINSNQLAFIQYTSGSTADPKGVMISHRNLLHNEKLIQLAFHQNSESIVVGWLPFYHDMGLIGNVIQPLYAGSRCILMSPLAFLQRPYRWLKTITKYQATTSAAPNFAYELCVRNITSEQCESLDLSSWQQALSGSEPVRYQTLKRFAETFQSCGFRWQSFYPCYGLAEATLFISGGHSGDAPLIYTLDKLAIEQHRVIEVAPNSANAKRLVACGKVSSEHKVIIVEPESATICSTNQIGEIWIYSASVAQGYLNRSLENKEIFQAYLANGEGPFLRTGDLGFIKDGELCITGRVKDILIIRGKNYYPQDIEWVVEQSHPSLRANASAAFSVDLNDEERLIVVAEVERRYYSNDLGRNFSHNQYKEKHLSERQHLQSEAVCQKQQSTSLNLKEVVTAIRRAIADHFDLQVYDVCLLKAGSISKTTSGKVQRRNCCANYLANALKVIAK